MMRGGPLRLVATAGAAVTAGIFTLSMLSSVSLGAFQTVMENKRVQNNPMAHPQFGNVSNPAEQSTFLLSTSR
jgi:hypothetical protein